MQVTDPTTGKVKQQLAEIRVNHKQIASLLAQGESLATIESVTGYSPSYISTLLRDPLFKDYMRDKAEYVDAKIEMAYDKVADAIIDGLENGTIEDRLKSARLQLEITGRIGKGDRPNAAVESSVERLNSLADRLLALQSNVRRGATYEQEPIEVVQQASG